MKRRELIKAGGLAAFVPYILSFTHDVENKSKGEATKIGYAILGLGSFAGYVIPRIRVCEKSKITALVSSDINKAKEWIVKYKLQDCKIYDYDSFEKIANDKSIDAVYIATPVGTHSHFALQSFNAGKHVITEKTMSASAQQALQMIVAANKAGKKLMVAYRARYEPFNEACIEFVKKETYGKVSAIAAHKGFYIGDRLGKGNWRISKALAGGGALMDIGIYSIQACRYLAGCEPVEVVGFAASTANDTRFKEVEENLSFTMKFPNGILATGSASWNYSLQNYFRVGAANGFFQLDPATPNGGIRMVVKQDNPTIIGERFFADVDQIPKMFDHFSECIIENREPKTNKEEGLKDLRVIEAIYQSVKDGKVVRLL